MTQAIVQNPNSVLQNALHSSLQGTTMKSRTFLHVATDHSSINAGGGTANTAFLATSGNPPGGNAKASLAQATFWIETIAGTGGQPDKHQLQYTQLVMLDFNGIHWPHVTVGTLGQAVGRRHPLPHPPQAMAETWYPSRAACHGAAPCQAPRHSDR